MYVLPDPVGACTTTSFPCCNAHTASCCHRSGITNPAPNPRVILGRCLQCGLLAIGIRTWFVRRPLPPIQRRACTNSRRKSRPEVDVDLGIGPLDIFAIRE